MTTQHPGTRQFEPEPQTLLPKPAYRDLFLAPDLPDAAYDEDAHATDAASPLN